MDIIQSLLRLAPRKSISTPKKLADHSKKQLLIDSTVTIMSANRKWPGYLASLNTLPVKDIPLKAINTYSALDFWNSPHVA